MQIFTLISICASSWRLILQASLASGRNGLAVGMFADKNMLVDGRTNLIASSLARLCEDWHSVFEVIVLKPGQILNYGDARATALYFPIDSVIADLMSPTSWIESNDKEVERRAEDSVQVGVYGPEDAAGLQSLLSAGISGRQTVVEFGGYALRCQVSAARRIMEQHPGTREIIQSYVALLLEELGQQAAAEQRLDVSKRVAAYLLRMTQAYGENAISITHAHISKRLGARRPSVTESINDLDKSGVLEQVDRGRIVIKSPVELRKIVNQAWPAMQNTREVFRSMLVNLAGHG